MAKTTVDIEYNILYPVEQKNGVRGCYRAGSCWHTVVLIIIVHVHQTISVLRPHLFQKNGDLLSDIHSLYVCRWCCRPIHARRLIQFISPLLS